MKKSKEKSVEPNEVENEVLVDDSLTDNQKFFIHFAQSWCSNKRAEAVKDMLMFNVHTPNVYRVIGSLKNFDEFSKAFSCPIDSQMSSDSKCTLI
jgi:predicted metalloendopeptidase